MSKRIKPALIGRGLRDWRINGLNVDAPAKFHGVEIGSVNRILLSLTQVENAIRVSNLAMIRVPVIIELDEKKIKGMVARRLTWTTPATSKG